MGLVDAKRILCRTKFKLIEELRGLEKENCVWLATDEAEGISGEIMVTENFDKIISGIKNGYWSESLDDSGRNDYRFFVQKYDTFESAYDVALSMRETNPKCYDAKRKVEVG